MAEKKFANEPLLYIHQPSTGGTQAPMQHKYMSKKRKAKEDKAVEEEKPVKKKISRRTSSFQQEPATDKTAVAKEEQIDKGSEETKSEKRKSFKEMDIPEKIDYFTSRPAYAPQVRCEIKSKGKNYRGLITGFEENMVFVKVSNRKTPISIPLDEIKDIQILGF
ncbi:CotO family spore coat protein [Oceanobacillus damuensis]|uniref:CotO family spore coat protein n=1 Tax=Oceanobacillus damuensis TaxID=937928 RepID=UPI000835E7FB|nr:CotO family spore coat protein [Oceanobacillus damuensis]